MKPEIIDYNKFMLGVDRADHSGALLQMLQRTREMNQGIYVIFGTDG
jgi:hypothetical protein